MQRREFRHSNLTFSYLDSGGDGMPVITLHAHWMEGKTFDTFASALAPSWRVIALDQRGHGHSDHAPSYTRDDYVGDLAALYAHLRIEEAVLLGNSLGGVNAYQFAARYPKRVRALVIEDISAVDNTLESTDLSFVLAWAGPSPSREALTERIGPRFLPYLADSFREVPGGWALAFDPRDMIASQTHLNGDHWADWLMSECPALLVRGRDSRVTTTAHCQEMATRRPHTRLVELDGGHVVHFDNPAGFAETVREFLRGI